MVINDIVHKIEDFLDKYPGSRRILEFWNGHDATNAFTGKLYKHSNWAPTFCLTSVWPSLLHNWNKIELLFKLLNCCFLSPSPSPLFFMTVRLNNKGTLQTLLDLEIYSFMFGGSKVDRSLTSVKKIQPSPICV